MNRDGQRGWCLGLVRQQDYLYLYWNKSGSRRNNPLFVAGKAAKTHDVGSSRDCAVDVVHREIIAG